MPIDVLINHQRMIFWIHILKSRHFAYIKQICMQWRIPSILYDDVTTLSILLDTIESKDSVRTF